MTRKAKIIIAAVVGSALLVGGAIAAAAVWFFLSVHDVNEPIFAEGPVDTYDDADYDETDSLEKKLRATEERLGPNHTELVPLLIELADIGLGEGRADDVVVLLERARRIQERAHQPDRPMLLETLDLLAAAHAMRQDYTSAVAVLEKALDQIERSREPVGVATALVRLASAQVHAGHDSRAQALVDRARRLINNCERRGECLGDELLFDLTLLDFARVERALADGDSAGANRLMRDIQARTARDGGDPCDALVDVVFDRVEALVMHCERLIRAEKPTQADRIYDTVFRMLALAETAGDCTELVDPYLVSDLTLTILRADLEAGQYARARARIDRLARYAQGHFDRGELRELVRYGITDVALEVAAESTGEGRQEEVQRLQRFILQLYAAMDLGDSPTMCEAVVAMSESDLATLDELLLADEIDAAEKLVDGLRQRYDDHHIRQCASERLRELALTLSGNAIDASDRHHPGSARRLLAIAESLCRKSGTECVPDIREAERQIR